MRADDALLFGIPVIRTSVSNGLPQSRSSGISVTSVSSTLSLSRAGRTSEMFIHEVTQDADKIYELRY